jgi:hypothetical protein
LHDFKGSILYNLRKHCDLRIVKEPYEGIIKYLGQPNGKAHRFHLKSHFEPFGAIDDKFTTDVTFEALEDDNDSFVIVRAGSNPNELKPISMCSDYVSATITFDCGRKYGKNFKGGLDAYIKLVLEHQLVLVGLTPDYQGAIKHSAMIYRGSCD